MLSSVILAVLLGFLRATVQGPHSSLRHTASLWDSEAERNFTRSSGSPSVPFTRLRGQSAELLESSSLAVE